MNRRMLHYAAVAALCTALLAAGAGCNKDEDPVEPLFNRDIDISPAVDGDIYDGLVFGPKDGIGDLVSGAAPTMVIENTDRQVNPYERRVVIEYDLSKIVGNVVAAKIRFIAQIGTGFTPRPFEVYSFAGDGALTTEDFADGELSTSFDFTGNLQLDVDVTAAVQKHVAANDGYVGLSLRCVLGSNDDPPPTLSLRTIEAGAPAVMTVTETVSRPIRPGR